MSGFQRAKQVFINEMGCAIRITRSKDYSKQFTLMIK